MNRLPRVLALITPLLVAPAAGAHEQGGRVMGVVASVTADGLIVKATDGHPVRCSVTAKTRFFQGDAPARLEDVRVGQRVVVHGWRHGEVLRADRVKLAAAPADPR